MSGRSNGCTIYIGNLDERVSDRVLYDILIQAGRVVDLHIPRDKESGRPRGYAFAEYENEEITNYAVKLFSGLVTLHNRTLKFAVSGQDKPSPSSSAITSSSNISHKSRSQIVPGYSNEISSYSNRLSNSCRFSAYRENHLEAPPYPGLVNQSNGYGSNSDHHNNQYSQRYSGTNLDSFNHPKSRRHDTSYPVHYPPYELLN
ncbi:RNA-binding protein 7-like isoform X1 [Cucurbita pepo subsp. pepo]|uniref:RNA-binding protein 7-like isoform X1 n=1 Tax=Cucurbita pepo subsp. pepo TaxID=3664 RepID=UPI000C9D317D|nr:RNA-binding protein 7-like isoform X1 [Cucurbita pepo subsp. pepo]